MLEDVSRCLVSAHPESSIEEVESYYCPHCLKYFAEAEASASANRCARQEGGGSFTRT
jgi:hypothetical protein